MIEGYLQIIFCNSNEYMTDDIIHLGREEPDGRC